MRAFPKEKARWVVGRSLTLVLLYYNSHIFTSAVVWAWKMMYNTVTKEKGNYLLMKVGIIMGSDSDLPVMTQAAEFFDEFGIEYEITIVSAHRTPDRMYEYAKSAKERGIRIIIAGAGGSAHLPGMTASITTLPVIGVPIQTKALGGLDSLYSIVQMPPGIPVATVSINGAKNAAILAASILSISDAALSEKLSRYKAELVEMVLEKVGRLENIGYKDYVDEMGKR